MPEPSGEESGLSVETGEGGIIPNDVMSFLYLRSQVELRVDDALSEVRRQTPLFQQTGFLDGPGTGHDNRTVAVHFRSSLEQKRNIY